MHAAVRERDSVVCVRERDEHNVVERRVSHKARSAGVG